MQPSSDELIVAGVSAGFGRRPVIENLSLAAIAPGQVVSLIGPNAAGKTTLLRSLAGLHPAHGSVRLGGRELMGMPLADRARLVTYMPQSLPQQVALTVLEAVIGALRASAADAMTPAGDAVVEQALQVIGRVGILPLAMRGLNQLSGGQRQLASLAQALVRSPRVLLLDEPISALDLHYQLRVMKLVRAVAAEQGMIVVMVLHDLMMAARWSDRVVVLANGAVAADGTPAEAITAPLLADVYRAVGTVETDSQGLRITIDDIVE